MKKNAFTLVELLAVIVILAVLLTIAVPAVSNYIVNSKKESYVVVMQEYLAAARNLILSEQVKAPLDKNEVTILSFDAIPLEKGTDRPGVPAPRRERTDPPWPTFSSATTTRISSPR